MAGLIPVTASLNGATVQQQYLWYAYPQFTQVAMQNIPIGKQRYDGFQSKVTKRFSKGLTVFASYTVSKTLQQIRLQNPQDLNLSNIDSIPLVKEPADQLDMPRKFAITGVYELPFGRGRHFASGIPKGLDYAIGGWKMSWNITYLSGEEVGYPNAPQASPGTAKLSNPTMLKWFNTSLWLNPSTGTYVSPPNLTYQTRTFPYEFSDVRLPPYHNWDASVSKNFTIHEQMRMQFRVDGVNALNHPWFSNGITTDVTNGAFGQLSPTERNLPRFIRLGLYLQW